MKKTLIAIALFVLLPVQSGAATWHKSIATATAEARKTNKLILVDMYAEWCGWCKRFEREVYPSEKFQAISKNLVLLKLDTEDGKEGTQFARRWGVSSLPTFVMLTPEHVFVGYLRGYSPTDEFVRRIEEAEDSYLDFRMRVLNEPKTATDADRLNLTNELISRADFPSAEERLRQHVMRFSDPVMQAEAYFKLALVYRMQEKYDQATNVVTEGLGANPKGANAEKMTLLMAEIYMEQRKFKDALDAYKRFKAAYPDSEMMATVDFIVPQLEAELAKKN